MAAIKASVNLFALLDGNDPGDKRLVDLDSQLKDQPKKKPASPGYKPKKEQASKKPASAAASTKKKPTSAAASGFNKSSEKSSPALAAGHNAPRKNLTPAAAASMARATNKQTTPAPPAPPAPSSTNLTGVLFAYPSARERIFKQRHEEFQRRQEEFQRQANVTEKGGSVCGDDGKSADSGAPADKTKKPGKTHGVKVQQGGATAGYYYNAAKQQPAVAVKEASAPRAVGKPATVPAVKTVPPPRPPSIDDIAHFPSLK